MKNNHSHDLLLPQWGPYSPNTFGLSCIHDPGSGSRMDFTLMPGFYRRNFAIPDARRQSGGLPWESSADLRYYSYRQQLEWKNKVYADLRFISCGENCRLISCTLVNRKHRSQDLALNLLCRMFPGLSVPCEVPGAVEILPPQLPGSGLNFDAFLPGEKVSSDTLPGGTEFPLAKGASVTFGSSVGFSGKKVWLLKKSAGKKWDFYLLEAAEGSTLSYTAGEDEILNRAVVMDDDRIPELRISQENTVAQVEKIAPEKYLLSFGSGKCYGIYLLQTPAFCRSYHVPDLEAFYRNSDLVFQKHLGESWSISGARESGFAISWQPLRISAKSEKEFSIYVASGSREEMLAFLRSSPPEKEPVTPLAFAASPFAFSAERMAATIMTNIIYPVRCNGEMIRHHTPGRLWSSLYTWDSGFIGLALLEMDKQRAVENLNAYLTEAGDPVNAFVHHGTPLPVQIFLFYEIWNRYCDLDFLKEFYPRVRQMYLYLAGHIAGSLTRTYCKLPLICTWDYFYNSGGWDDYPPQWSRVRQTPAPRIIPMITTSILIRAAKMLRGLGKVLGEDTELFDRDIADFSSAIQHAWDQDSGYFGYLETDPDGEPKGIWRFRDGSNYNMGGDGVSPLYGGEISREQKEILWSKVSSSKHLWTKYGISAVDQSASYFSLDGYWNGSIWFPHQWFLWKAALNDGRGKFALKIALTALRIWKRETEDAYCCFEHFSISSGSGGGWHHFSGLSSPVICWYNACFKPGTLSTGYDVLITGISGGEYQLEISGSEDEVTSLLYCGKVKELRYNGKKIVFSRGTSQVVCFELPKGTSGTLLISPGE